MNRLIEVMHGAILQPAGQRIVFLAIDIRVHLAQQLERLVQPARTIGGPTASIRV